MELGVMYMLASGLQKVKLVKAKAPDLPTPSA